MTHTMKILFWKVGGHPEINFVWSEGTQNHDFWVPGPPKVPQKPPKTRVRGPSPPPDSPSRRVYWEGGGGSPDTRF